MQVIVLLDGLTFGGKVYKAGEFADTESSGFPTFALSQEYRDSAGRKWFRLLETPTEETVETLACSKCGKEYKSSEWLEKHEAKCDG